MKAWPQFLTMNYIFLQPFHQVSHCDNKLRHHCTDPVARWLSLNVISCNHIQCCDHCYSVALCKLFRLLFICITHVQNWVYHQIRKMAIVIQRNIYSSLQDYLVRCVLTIIQIKHHVQVRFLKCFYQGKLSSHARESSWWFFSILNDDKCISVEKQWIIKIRPLIKTIKDQICYLIYPTSRLHNIND